MTIVSYKIKNSNSGYHISCKWNYCIEKKKVIRNSFICTRNLL